MHPSLLISTAQLRANIQSVRSRIAPSELLFVLKDDAYGHGLRWATETAVAEGVRWLGTFDIPTALAVRRIAGEGPRVLALATSAPDEVAEAIEADVDLGVGSAEYLDVVIAAAKRLHRRVRIHLKVDTGLHRNGFRPESWSDALARAGVFAAGVDVVGVWSHLAEASDAEDDVAAHAFDVALRAVRHAGFTPEVTHLTASAASWARPELRQSLSRIGAFCYGIRSADGPVLPGIEPVATLIAPVIGVEDDVVRIAIGSLDGVPSILRGIEVGTPRGRRMLRAVGLIDSEVASWPGAAVGDRVVVFGPASSGAHSPTTLAESIDTVGEEVVTRLTNRVTRVIDAEEPR